MLRFEEAGAPDAGRIATRLHDLMPTPPIDGADSVYRLLSELPQIEQTDTVVEVSGSDWKFDVPRWSHTAGVAEAVGLTPAELDWFADPGGWLRTKATPLQHYRYRIRSDNRLSRHPRNAFERCSAGFCVRSSTASHPTPRRTDSSEVAASTPSPLPMRGTTSWCASTSVPSFPPSPRRG